MKERIYFDHAATTPLEKEVLEKMLPYFSEHYGNADSPHATGRKAMNAVDDARDTLAALLGARPNETYFTSGGTESDNWAIVGGAYAMRERGRTQLVVSSIEHHAAHAAAARLEKQGFTVVWLPANGQGVVEAESLRAVISENTALVAVMAANNETGAIQPVKELAAVAHEYGALFFTDAVQYAPYGKIDVKAWDVDMLSISAHKFYGPKGCGALYIRSGLRAEKLIVGGEQERGLRGGTTNVPAVVGMAAAYAAKERGLLADGERIKNLRGLFLREIADLDGVHINGDPENGLPALLNLRFEGVNNADLVYAMDLKGVSVAAGAACASASIKPSHVLLAMGLSEAAAKECVRFSFGKYNAEEEIVRGAGLVKETVRRLRGL